MKIRPPACRSWRYGLISSRVKGLSLGDDDSSFREFILDIISSTSIISNRCLNIISESMELNSITRLFERERERERDERRENDDQISRGGGSLWSSPIERDPPHEKVTKTHSRSSFNSKSPSSALLSGDDGAAASAPAFLPPLLFVDFDFVAVAAVGPVVVM